MPKYKPSAEKATESATFRFTSDEKRLLAFLAEKEGVTYTDLIRELLLRRARELNIDSLPPRTAKRRPGRPKKSPHGPKGDAKRGKTEVVMVHNSSPLDSHPSDVKTGRALSRSSSSFFVSTSETDDLRGGLAAMETTDFNEVLREAEEQSIRTFGDLVVAFRGHFSKRAEGTRRELEDTVQFLIGQGGLGSFIDEQQVLSQLDSKGLDTVREKIKAADIRFPKKNLHLTYLRMMLHWAIKQKSVPIMGNPKDDLRAFTAKEIADAWPTPANPLP